MDTFKVYSRCRPLNELQISQGASKKSVTIINQTTLSLSDGYSKQHIFQLDGVYDQNATNFHIFNQAIIPLIQNVLNGINSTAFAYGITGAGKSFTMFGKHNKNQYQKPQYNELIGIIPLTFEYFVNLTHHQPQTKIKISYLQIYNQQVYDLFQQNQQNLQLNEDPIQGCVVVQDLTQIMLTSFEQIQSFIELGNSRRVIAQTRVNQVSSRSHVIVIINVQRKINQSNQYYSAKLSLVDLAGSEKQSVHYEKRGIRTFEGSNINRSLLTLGNCINILSQKRKTISNTQTFIPYRDSKLTRLLKDSLGGNTKTIMITCISPSFTCYQQTINTLKYACRANKIQKIVHTNIKQMSNIEQYKKQIIHLKKKNQLLKMNLNMSLMVPKLNSQLVCQDNRIRKNRVWGLLDKLTKEIQERVILLAVGKVNGNEENVRNVKDILKNEEDIKQMIISEFEMGNPKDKTVNKNSIHKLSFPSHQLEPTTKNLSIQQLTQNCKLSLPTNDSQLNTKKYPQIEQFQPNPTKYLRRVLTIDSIPKSKNQQKNNAYNQYKLSLKDQPRYANKPEQCYQYNGQNSHASSNNNTKNKSLGNLPNINYQLINLENLRRKIMEDKKQLSSFKQEIKSGRLTNEQIQKKSEKLLQMEESSVLRFSNEEKQYLIKLAKGEFSDSQFETNYMFSSLFLSDNKYKQHSLRNHKKDGQFILNIIEQNGVENSRNRHLESFKRIMEMKNRNSQLPTPNYNFHSQQIIENQFSSSLKQQIHPQMLTHHNYSSVHQQLSSHVKNQTLINYTNTKNHCPDLNSLYIGHISDTYRNRAEQSQNFHYREEQENKMYDESDIPRIDMNDGENSEEAEANNYSSQGNSNHQEYEESAENQCEELF